MSEIKLQKLNDQAKRKHSQEPGQFFFFNSFLIIGNFLI